LLGAGSRGICPALRSLHYLFGRSMAGDTSRIMRCEQGGHVRFYSRPISIITTWRMPYREGNEAQRYGLVSPFRDHTLVPLYFWSKLVMQQYLDHNIHHELNCVRLCATTRTMDTHSRRTFGASYYSLRATGRILQFSVIRYFEQKRMH
jgi:hypothetical protein